MEGNILRFYLYWLAVVAVLGSAKEWSPFRKPVFSTKTPYFWERDLKHPIEMDENSWFEDNVNHQSCQIFHLGALIRHGIRFPGIKWITKMSQTHEKLKDLEFLKEKAKTKFIEEWKNPFPEESQHELSAAGAEEQFQLGKRFGKRFGLLWEGDMKRVKFISSSKPRCSDSGHLFIDGLVESLDSNDASNRPTSFIEDDTMLRFHENCPKYASHVAKNKTALAEYNNFKTGLEMTNVVHSVSDKITGNQDYLNLDDVRNIHQICAFELAMHNKSDWCQFFTQHDFEVMDYFSDLKHYWKKAYGYKINADISCPVISDIFQEIDEAILTDEEQNDYTIAVLRFGHAETLAPVYAALGLFRDEAPLKSSNFHDNEKRKFRGSKILPFSANIAFAVFECEKYQPHENEEEELEMEPDEIESVFYLQILINEEPVVIPACGKRTCRYTQVKSYYKHLLPCEFEHMCKLEPHDEL